MRLSTQWLIAILAFGLCASCADSVQEKTSTFIPEILSLENPASSGGSLSRLIADDNYLYLSWVQKTDTISTLYYAPFNGQQWADPVNVSSGTDWFVNWADFPVISVNDPLVLSTYLKKSDTATYAYDVRYNHFNGETNKGKKDVLLHADSTNTEHGFVSVVPSGRDKFHIVWLDGRFTAGHGHGTSTFQEQGAMTLRGAIISPDGSVIESTQLDSRVCDCCQTSMATTTNYTWVAYRDRSEREVRDISIVRKHRDHGWEDPISVSNDDWKINGCPVNGPSIDSFESNVALAWFTAPDEEGVVNLSFGSETKGFGPKIRVDNGNATGRVSVVMDGPTSAWILWMEPQGDKEVIQLAHWSSDGTKHSEVTISEISPERASGFPQLQLFQDTLYVSYTDLSSGAPHIKLSAIPLAK
ncbi:MAG: hypothetical protein CMC35_00120 [Flavobacteriaceae bacterium]|nr:hypothetical protein [Flavobacteriaceae bacterium]|tara:strand:- start:16978 stop:18219 length:1242 start_codon:yes stop_codon:yes gene_type:complete